MTVLISRLVRSFVLLSVPLLFARGEASNQLLNLADVPKSERHAVPKERVWPERFGQAHVCTWKDDAFGAFSITIDDNTQPDHDWWIEQGKKYGFHFTWFVVTDGLNADKNQGFTGTWADFQQLVDLGHDVQSHTVRHRSKRQDAPLPLANEYRDSRDHIDAHLKNARCLTLAYPGGGHPNDTEVAKRYYAGARGTVGTPNSASPDYLNTRSIGGASSALKQADEKGSWASIYGIAEPDPAFPKNARGWYCMHFHGVWWNEKTRDENVRPLVALLDYVKAHEADLWVGTFREIVLYGQERDTAKITVANVSPDEIRLSLTDRMLDEWYTYPLTVKVRVAAAWRNVSATQGGKPVAARLVTHDGARHALVQAVPDRGEVVVRPL